MFTIEFVGHLGADPVEDTTKREVSISVAVDNGFSKEGTRLTRWVYCHSHVSNPLPELRKGSKVWVKGVPRWSWRKNGDDVDIFLHVSIVLVVLV